MSNWKGLRARVRSLLRRRQAEQRMAEEFRFHLEMEVEKNLGAGLSAEEARRRAVLAFGGTELHGERMRDGRGARWLDDLVRDVRVGVRALLRTPDFTIVALLTIAFGIGATTAVFSAVDAVLLRPLPFRAPERLVEIDDVRIPFEDEPSGYSPDITAVRALDDVFTGVAAYAPGGVNLSGRGTPRRAHVGVVTPGLFALLGIAPALGREFTEEEGRPGERAVAILSDGVWRSAFGADPGVIGADVRLNGKPYTVVGVMPRGFSFPEESEAWVPLTVPTTFAAFEYWRQYMPSRMIARLAPGATLELAESRLRLLASHYKLPDGRDPQVPSVRRLHTSLVGDHDTALYILLGATALVLLVACANVANLLLSRALVRRREIALRGILGATSGRVVRQLLTESTLITVIGGTLGIALAFAGAQLLGALIPAPLSGVAPIRIDARVLAFVVVVAIVTGIGVGLWPALEARRTDANALLKAGTAGAGGSGESTRLRRIFVVGELALALMLLIGSVLMLRSLHALLTTDSGVRAERVATLELTLASGDHSTVESRRAFYQQVLERLRARPEVDAAAAINELPLRGVGGVRFTMYPVGRKPPEQDVRHMAQDLRIAGEYFRAMGIRVLEGRAPRARPDTLAQREVAISRSLAELYWPGRSPLGYRIEPPGPSAPTFEIVGVVDDVRPSSIEDDFIPQAYFSCSIRRTTMPQSSRAAEYPPPP